MQVIGAHPIGKILVGVLFCHIVLIFKSVNVLNIISNFRRQSEMRLTVRLLDINDNRPQFERIGCVGELDRDLVNPGANVFTLSALDFDAGNIINYRFVSGNSDGCFR